MSELCGKFCPAYTECRSRLEAVIAYSGNLHIFKQELETAAVDRGRRVFGNAALPLELLEDIQANNTNFRRLKRDLVTLMDAQITCDGPIPSSQGITLMKDDLLRAHTDEETRQKYIYNRDVTCGQAVGSIILSKLPSV